MKFSIDKNLLESITNKLGKTLDGNNTALPILNSVLVSVSNEAVQFAASNGEDAIVINEGKATKEDNELLIEAGGEICIPKDAFKVFKKLKKGLVTFETNADGTIVKIYQKRTELVFAAFKGSEYPNLKPSTQENVLFSMPMELLIKMVSKTAHCAFKSSSIRPILECINFQMQTTDAGTAYSVASTDAHRLSKLDSKVQFNQELPITSFNLKASTLKDLCSRTFDKHKTDNVYIQVFRSAVLFLMGDLRNGNNGNYTTVIIRQVEGDYPDVSKLIPNNEPNTFQTALESDDLYGALDLISMMDGNKDTVVKLNKELATLSSKLEAGTTSKGKQEVPLNIPVPNEFEIAFNTKFLMESLRAIETEVVNVQMCHPLRPILILPSVNNDEPLEFAHLELLLPIRTY